MAFVTCKCISSGPTFHRGAASRFCERMATTLSVRPNRLSGGSSFHRPLVPRSDYFRIGKPTSWRGAIIQAQRRAFVKPARPVQAGSRADDSAPFEMSVENALKLLGVSEGASFDDILGAKNSILATCNGDKEAIAQVEAAYDMLLMKSLSQRRAGKVVDSGIRFADVKSISSPGIASMPQWLQDAVKTMPVSIKTPTTGDLGIQAGIFGALMVLTFVNGATTASSEPYAGADVPGLILAGSFGASLYFINKRNVKLGKAVVITVGGLVIGAVVGSAVENWLQVDIIPFLGLHSPAAVVSEFILFSQLLVSLYLR